MPGKGKEGGGLETKKTGFTMKGTALYKKVKNDRGISTMTLNSPMDHKTDMRGYDESSKYHTHETGKFETDKDGNIVEGKVKSPNKHAIGANHEHGLADPSRSPNKHKTDVRGHDESSKYHTHETGTFEEDESGGIVEGTVKSPNKLTEDAAMKFKSMAKKGYFR